MDIINFGWGELIHWQQIGQLAIDFPFETNLLAQRIEDPDVLGQMQRAFTNFIESGQVWALGIGLFIGYSFKSMLP